MGRNALLVVLVVLVIPLAFGRARADGVADAVVLHVAPDGNDAWSGRLERPKAAGTDGPLRSFAGARDAVRRLKARGPLEKPIRVVFQSGTYPISEPIVFGPEDSGAEKAPITYAAAPGAGVTISGGRPVGPWRKQAAGPLWTAQLPDVAAGGRYFRSLYVGGKRCIPARTPNDDWFFIAGPEQPLGDREAARRDVNKKKSFRYQGDDIRPWSNLEDAVLVYFHAWTSSRHPIERIEQGEKLVRLANPSNWPMGWWGKDERYFVEFVPEALDSPGEWYLDRKTGVLTYYPRPGEDMTTAEAIAPSVEVLVRFEGDAAAGRRVEHLRFEGLAFHHTDWSMPTERSKMWDGQAAAFLGDAAILLRGARHCLLRRCEIAHVGGYGLWFERGTKDCRAEQCEIHDLGAGGVRLGEMTLPAQAEEQAERNTVHNCFIHDGGHVYHAGVGAWIGRSSHNTLSHNEICDFYYSGVSVGWSWGYAPSSAHHNTIEHNHIHHLGWGKLSDMGGIYCLGDSPGTRLVHNLIHDVWAFTYGGWGLYTDEGSTGILMEDNVVYRVKDGCFHQHYGKENIVRNNVLAFSMTDRGQIRRSRDEQHLSFTVERNILYYDRAPLLGGNWGFADGYRFDANCYWHVGGEPPMFPGNLSFDQWRAKGQDRRSIVADPRFVDPSQGDFRLKDDSPALRLGYRPIDMDSFGLIGEPDWTERPRRVQRPEMKMQ